MSASRCLKRLLHDDDGGLRASDGDQLPILAVAALERDNISATWIAHDMKFSRAVLSWIVKTDQIPNIFGISPRHRKYLRVAVYIAWSFFKTCDWLVSRFFILIGLEKDQASLEQN